MKFGKKSLVASVLAVTLAIPMVASAYSKSFSFDISQSVSGTTIHSLAALDTQIQSDGQTYWSSGSIQTNKANYTVALERFLKSYAAGFVANGNTYNKSVGVVTKNDYTVKVTKTSGGSYGDRVKGSGYIFQ